MAPRRRQAPSRAAAPAALLLLLCLVAALAATTSSGAARAAAAVAYLNGMLQPQTQTQTQTQAWQPQLQPQLWQPQRAAGGDAGFEPLFDSRGWGDPRFKAFNGRGFSMCLKERGRHFCQVRQQQTACAAGGVRRAERAPPLAALAWKQAPVCQAAALCVPRSRASCVQAFRSGGAARAVARLWWPVTRAHAHRHLHRMHALRHAHTC